jgi:hypothetical protein
MEKHAPTESSSNPDLEKNEPASSTANSDETDRSTYQVQFDDGENPKAFSPYYKAFLTWEISMLACVSSLGSSIMSPAQTDLSEYLSISKELTVLSLSLFVLGMCLCGLVSFLVLNFPRIRLRSVDLGPDQRSLRPEMVHAAGSICAWYPQHRNCGQPESG